MRPPGKAPRKPAGFFSGVLPPDKPALKPRPALRKALNRRLRRSSERPNRHSPSFFFVFLSLFCFCWVQREAAPWGPGVVNSADTLLVLGPGVINSAGTQPAGPGVINSAGTLGPGVINSADTQPSISQCYHVEFTNGCGTL